MPLSAALTLDLVRTLADDKTYQRGLAYFHDGAVGRLEEDNEEVRANVQGTHRYRVMLATGDDDSLEYDCNCPVGIDGSFCKHAVAVALAWLELRGEEVFQPPEPGKPKRKRISKADQVGQYLSTLDENQLRDILIEASDWDRRLRDRLLFAAKVSAVSDIPTLRAAVRQATKTSGFLDWREACGYGEQLYKLATLLERRIADGNAKLVEVIEEAIAGAESALQQIDDSNDEVYPAIRRLQEVHRRACTSLHPDPVALADRLFDYQMNGAWDTFLALLPDYEDALGRRGLARYRQLLKEKWDSLPSLGPADQRRQRWDSRRFRVAHAMEALARLSGDIDTVAAIKAKDLSSPRCFLDLAVLYYDHGRFDEALSWAEKGIAAFRGDRIQELLGFAIEEYLRRGDQDQVAKLAWERFALTMESNAYFLLLKDAARIGRREELRPKALAALWEQVQTEERHRKSQQRLAPLLSSRSQLLEIFVTEGDSDQAWSTLTGGATDMRLWAKTAALRGTTHPAEAIRLYFQLLPHKIQAGTRNARYDEAVEVVQAIRNLRLAQGDAATFPRELAAIRLEYKAKRNFIKALAPLG